MRGIALPRRPRYDLMLITHPFSGHTAQTPQHNGHQFYEHTSQGYWGLHSPPAPITQSHMEISMPSQDALATELEAVVESQNAYTDGELEESQVFP